MADWLVLDERDGKTLLLSKDIIERHPYNADAIVRKGKNWYVSRDDFTLTINAHSHTIITAHKTKKGGR
jgi:hypothetical protein